MDDWRRPSTGGVIAVGHFQPRTRSSGHATGDERPKGVSVGRFAGGRTWLMLILGTVAVGGVLIVTVPRLSRQALAPGAGSSVAARADESRPPAAADRDRPGEEEGGDRADEPLAAARYMIELQQGGIDAPIPAGALGRAFDHVEAMRKEIPGASRLPEPGARMEALVALPADEGSEALTYFVGGMPVGPLPRRVPRVLPAAPLDEGALPAPIDPMAGAVHLEFEDLPRPPAVAPPRPAPRAPADAAAPPPAAAAAPGPGPGGIMPSRWKSLGPGNVGGRTRALLIHPTYPNIMWLGAVSGGIWKTDRQGASWDPLPAFATNLNVSCLALDPTDPDVIYAGTGEGFYNVDAFRGEGIFRSTNGGETWEQLTRTPAPVMSIVWRLRATGAHCSPPPVRACSSATHSARRPRQGREDPSQRSQRGGFYRDRGPSQHRAARRPLRPDQRRPVHRRWPRGARFLLDQRRPEMGRGRRHPRRTPRAHRARRAGGARLRRQGLADRLRLGRRERRYPLPLGRRRTEIRADRQHDRLPPGPGLVRQHGLGRRQG